MKRRLPPHLEDSPQLRALLLRELEAAEAKLVESEAAMRAAEWAFEQISGEVGRMREALTILRGVR